MKKYQKGFSAVTLLVVLAIIFVLVSAGSFYYLKFQGKSLTSSLPFVQVAVTPTPEPTTSGISTSTDISITEKELDETTIDSIDTELNKLDSSASSL